MPRSAVYGPVFSLVIDLVDDRFFIADWFEDSREGALSKQYFTTV